MNLGGENCVVNLCAIIRIIHTKKWVAREIFGKSCEILKKLLADLAPSVYLYKYMFGTIRQLDWFFAGGPVSQTSAYRLLFYAGTPNRMVSTASFIHRLFITGYRLTVRLSVAARSIVLIRARPSFLSLFLSDYLRAAWLFFGLHNAEKTMHETRITRTNDIHKGLWAWEEESGSGRFYDDLNQSPLVDKVLAEVIAGLR